MSESAEQCEAVVEGDEGAVGGHADVAREDAELGVVQEGEYAAGGVVGAGGPGDGRHAGDEGRWDIERICELESPCRRQRRDDEAGGDLREDLVILVERVSPIAFEGDFPWRVLCAPIVFRHEGRGCQVHGVGLNEPRRDDATDSPKVCERI